MKKLLFLLIIINIGCKSKETLIGKNYSEIYESVLFPIKYDESWGYADYFGNTVIDPQFDEATLLHYGIAIVKKDNRYGYINNMGQWIVKPKFKTAETFQSRFYGLKNKDRNPEKKLIAKVNEGQGDFYINSNGKPIKKVTLNTSSTGCVQIIPQVDKYSIRNEDGSYELKHTYWSTKSDTSWHKVIDTTQLRLDAIIELDRNFALLQKGNKFAIFNIDQAKGIDPIRKERIVIAEDSVYTIEPNFIYEDVKFKRNNGNETTSSIYKKDGKWGILTVGGQELVPFIYLDIIEEENSGSYMVEFEEDKFGYISVVFESNEVMKGREITKSGSIVREHFRRNK